MAFQFNTTEQQEKFAEDVLTHLGDDYSYISWNTKKEVKIQGQSMSYLKTCMRDHGWKNIGCDSDFDSLLQKAGFEVIQNCKNSRGQKTRVVTL